jgi:hypothetical protein
MGRQARFWRELSLGLLLLAFPRCTVGQNTACDPKELEASLPSTDEAYPDATALSQVLSKHRITVKCILRSTMDGTFDEQEGAAVYRTDHGDFEVVFLPKPKTFDRLKVIERRNRKQYSYRFKGPPQPWPANLIESAFPIYFIKDRNVLLVVQGNRQLAQTLEKLVRSEGT